MARTNNKKGTAETDAALAEALAERDTPQWSLNGTGEVQNPEGTEPETPVDIPEEREPNIADRFVGINQLIVSERQRTRLSEATLIKGMEIAIQYHAWDYSRRQAEAQAAQRFDPRSLMGNDGVGSEDALDGPTGEYIGEAADDNVVPVNFTPETTEED